MSVVQDGAPAPGAVEPPHLVGIDHVEWWVGNARAFTALLTSAFGFEEVGYAGPETGRRDRVSHVLQQGSIRFLVTGALTPDSPVAEHVLTHGDGVRDVCFVVEDVTAGLRGRRRPRRPPRAPAEHRRRRARGRVARGGRHLRPDGPHVPRPVGLYGGFAPGYGPPVVSPSPGPVVGLTRLDHVVANVEQGHLDDWVAYYQDVFGFDQMHHFDDEAISTEFSALMSTVVWNGGEVVLPINEPADGRKKSQIEEYLDYYRSPGVQHLALATDDIVSTVDALRQRGVRFMDVPPTYYDEARARMAGIDLPWDELSSLGILVDRDERGHLLQVFTETVCDRPTVFFEVIQREGATGFGEGNFKALFESIERAQAARGNL